jgi:hypothetical protein
MESAIVNLFFANAEMALWDVSWAPRRGLKIGLTAD